MKSRVLLGVALAFLLVSLAGCQVVILYGTGSAWFDELKVR